MNFIKLCYGRLLTMLLAAILFFLPINTVNAQQTTRLSSDELKILQDKAIQGDIGAKVTLGFPSSYIAKTDVPCAQYEVTIATACDPLDADYGYPRCFSQRILIKEKSTIKVFVFTNPKYYEDMALIRGAKCEVTPSGKYILNLSISNLGSGRTCNDCEWSEFINLSGNYLGASGGRTLLVNNKNRKMKDIPTIKALPCADERPCEQVTSSRNRTTDYFSVNLYPTFK